MKRMIQIGDVVFLNNGQKFRVIYALRNGEDVFMFVDLSDWNVYFERNELGYGIGDEINEGITIEKIMSAKETPTSIAIV
jgi:hypothetical protein